MEKRAEHSDSCAGLTSTPRSDLLLKSGVAVNLSPRALRAESIRALLYKFLRMPLQNAAINF